MFLLLISSFGSKKAKKVNGLKCKIHLFLLETCREVKDEETNGD